MKPKTAVELYDSSGEVVYILADEPVILEAIDPEYHTAALTVLLTPTLKSQLFDYFLKRKTGKKG